jgi:hypothetical protein
MSDGNLIAIELNLPDHSNQLNKAEEIIEKYKNKIKFLQAENNIDNDKHSIIYEEIVCVLDYVGGLSGSALKVEEKLEDIYMNKYKRTPQLAKQLWLEHYEIIHRPYNTLKNRCHRMLDELDEIYKNKFGNNPPNWNI